MGSSHCTSLEGLEVEVRIVPQVFKKIIALLSIGKEKSKMNASLDDLYELLYVAAYGCNRRCEREIKKVFHEYNKDTPLFFFFEFFVSQPLPKSPESLSWGAEWEKDVYLLMPFAPRLAEHSAVVPDTTDKDPKATFFTAKGFQKIKMKLRWDCSKNTKDTFEKWKDAWIDQEGSKEQGEISCWEKVMDQTTGCEYQIGFVNDWTFDWQAKHPGEITHDRSKWVANALAILYKPSFVDRTDENVKGIFVPIASTRLFYGGIWVMFPVMEDQDPWFRRTVGLCVAKLIDQTYLPVLALLHEHWLEKLHDDWLDQSKGDPAPPDKPFPTGEPDNATFRNSYHRLGGMSDDVRKRRRRGVYVADEIECLLQTLWERRAKGERWGEKKAFQDSLVFKDYLICSQSMIQLLSAVITAAKTLRKSRTTLPACLVVGGPGSGKEQLAIMLRLFSEEYSKGLEYVVNLAAIRPAPLTAALITGIEWEGTPNLRLHGFLQRIREVATREKTSPTLRLDEFNSMDSDSQGVLLRFLDNSEIIAVGGLQDEEKDKTDCLVIGIMNEDPEDISRERAMEFVRGGQYLGGFLGDMLYEHFLRMRRLRPDVMYRMIRNGKFVIPPLRDRSEDIPLLFQVYVKKELKAGTKDRPSLQISLHISLEVLSRLMGSDLPWQGNIRQLQALAKLVAERLLSDTPEQYLVTSRLLEKALEEVGLISPELQTKH